mmetsp:Transcript_20226/g.42480  ORF Transcript_20226/g.42480 Transcript_20226/m.42480 type:complete len:108 (-) Transcript_20226:261-584(-)
MMMDERNVAIILSYHKRNVQQIQYCCLLRVVGLSIFVFHPFVPVHLRLRDFTKVCLCSEDMNNRLQENMTLSTHSKEITPIMDNAHIMCKIAKQNLMRASRVLEIFW